MRAIPISRPNALRGRLPSLGWPELGGLLAALLISLLLGYLAYTRLTTPAPVTVQTVAATRGSISAGVNGTGTVMADQSSKVSFRGSGRVADVYVKVGDQVQAGQALAKLDDADLQAQLAQAQANEASAQSKLQVVQNGARPEDLAAAQAALAQADAKLQDLLTPRAPDVDAARAAVAQEQAKLQGLLQGRPEDVTAAQAQVDAAVAKLQGMQAQGRPEDIAAAQAGLDQAQAKLDALYHPSAADLAAAQSAVDQAQATLTSSQAKLADVQAGATAADLQAAQADLANAQSQQQSAQAKLNALLQPASA